jgi:hypothetical protein
VSAWSEWFLFDSVDSWSEWFYHSFGYGSVGIYVVAGSCSLFIRFIVLGICFVGVNGFLIHLAFVWFMIVLSFAWRMARVSIYKNNASHLTLLTVIRVQSDRPIHLAHL